MKKALALLAIMGVAFFVSGAPVSVEKARLTAACFYRFYHMGNQGSPKLKDMTTSTYQDITTYYTFRFLEGGFVIIAADDAVIPVLGYSFEDDAPGEDSNPSAKAWLENYSKQICIIKAEGLSNKETLKQWNSILKGTCPPPGRDVGPLVTTRWNQGCYFNALCPYDNTATSSCLHTYTGCVPTAMAQVIKYHNFPDHGVGSHSYLAPGYGLQSVDYGNTWYNWPAMLNHVTSPDTAVATLMYHCGVSIDVHYGPDGTNGVHSRVPAALVNYFNFDAGLEFANMASYPNVADWENLLRRDLDSLLPIYYGDPQHGFVCDGYRSSDNTFHFNWGWGGAYNGNYAIGALNAGGYNFSYDNIAILHIKPANPDLIVRVLQPYDMHLADAGQQILVKAKTIRGTATAMKIFIDGLQVASGNCDSLLYTWNTTTYDLGKHEIKAEAWSGSSTASHKIEMNVSRWRTQSSGFPAAGRAVLALSAVDENVAWAAAWNSIWFGEPCNEFSRTTDGGNTWTGGAIPNTQGLLANMMFALDSMKAWVPMDRIVALDLPGLFYTEDGGTTWTRQNVFSSASVPAFVHFFNAQEGCCIGDPLNGEFEIYTTSNGGTTWTPVNGANIPNPVASEASGSENISSVGNHLWFGTWSGRIFRSADRGATWSASQVPGANYYCKPVFRDSLHGLAAPWISYFPNLLYETSDGGITWTSVNYNGTVYGTGLAFVKGTPDTWVSTGGWEWTETGGYSFGASVSYDGGHNWTVMPGTQGSLFTAIDMVNDHCGWAGSFNTHYGENGMFKFTGIMMALPAPMALQATVTNSDVHLTWTAPAYNPGVTIDGYNLFRDGTKVNPSLIIGPLYDDLNVPYGLHTYCVKAIYNAGESDPACAQANVTVGIPEDNASAISVFPNPAGETLNIYLPGLYEKLSIYNAVGQEIFSRLKPESSLSVDVSDYPAGIYILSLIKGDRVSTLKITVE